MPSSTDQPPDGWGARYTDPAKRLHAWLARPDGPAAKRARAMARDGHEMSVVDWARTTRHPGVL